MISRMAIWGALTICGALVGCAPTAEKSAQAAPEDAKTLQTATPQNTVASRPTADGKEAVKIFVDPTTGEIREPTEDELKAIARDDLARKQITSAKPTTTASSPEILLPNGSVATKLGRSSSESLRACIQKDGSMAVDHECKSDVVGSRAKQ
jgi:hypothetical protein